MFMVVLVGFSTYLYLPLRAELNCSPSWGYPIHFSLFFWVVSRQLIAGHEPWIQNPLFYFETVKEISKVFVFYWLPGFIFFVLIGMRILWINEKRVALAMLLLLLPVFAGIVAIHEQKNIYLLHAYLVPLAGLIGVFGFWGFRSLFTFTNNKMTQWMMIFLFIFVSVAWFIHVFQIESKNEYLAAEDFGENVMKPLPEGSILLAEGDHYVMSIWYERFVKQKRQDLIFEPSVFLLHGWGWKQLANQSKDLNQVESGSTLFGNRLEFLTRFPLAHPLYYSLSMMELGPVLAQMPGIWVPKGLTYEWESQKPNQPRIDHPNIRTFQDLRIRGMDYWGSPAMDPSTAEIYRYYHSEPF